LHFLLYKLGGSIIGRHGCFALCSDKIGGKSPMKKRDICLYFVIMLFLTNILSPCVIAGDENDPEITDNDHDILGPKELMIFPQLLYPLFNNIDIISGWIYENAQHNDILYVSIKLDTFDYKSFFNMYVVMWNYNNINYLTIYNTYSNGEFQIAGAGYSDEIGEDIQEVDITIDHEHNVLTWIVPKYIIGNPSPGDELEYPWIFTCTRFQNSMLQSIYGGELGKDITNPGRFYTIEY
jgi:hypothetical protein